MDQVEDQVWRAGYGAHDANWLGFYDFFLEKCGLDGANRLRGLLDLAKHCGWFWPFEGVVILTERPNKLERDSHNQLHCEDGPALSYPDGFSLWKWHGVTVSEDIILSPEKITIQRIEQETNSEVRRVMIERYGAEKYVIDSGATVVEELSPTHPIVGLRTARLLKKEIPGDEPIIYVDLLNSTAEGTWVNNLVDGVNKPLFKPDIVDGKPFHKRYMLRVDPNAYNGEASTSAHAAAASTWRDQLTGALTYPNWRDYAPATES
ncbi:MAG: hypothetical protein IPP74_15330 [Alphaproteobacteria bacterium]|nr:hypothetical protein [Alphaproteobacteria bacterium]